MASDNQRLSLEEMKAEREADKILIAQLRKRARTAERESMRHMAQLKGLERVATTVSNHSDEVCVENNQLRAQARKDQSSIVELQLQVEALKKQARTEEQIQRAAEILPVGWELIVRIEKGAGCAGLFDANGNQVHEDFHGEYLADEIENAINAANHIPEAL